MSGRGAVAVVSTAAVAVTFLLMVMMVVGDFFAVHKIRHLFCLPTGKVRFPPLNFNLVQLLTSCFFLVNLFYVSFNLGSSTRVFLVNEEKLEHRCNY